MAYSWNGRITRTTIVFVVGIIVIAGLVFGGIWFAKERGEQARQKEAIAIAEQNLTNQSEAVKDADATSDEHLPPTEAEVRAQEEAARAAAAAQASRTQNSAELPATGPELSQILIVTILALSISYYMASRRQVSHR